MQRRQRLRDRAHDAPQAIGCRSKTGIGLPVMRSEVSGQVIVGLPVACSLLVLIWSRRCGPVIRPARSALDSTTCDTKVRTAQVTDVVDRSLEMVSREDAESDSQKSPPPPASSTPPLFFWYEAPFFSDHQHDICATFLHMQ